MTHSETQTGFAIWSKKSDKELQRELKKALEKKALNVPDSVAMIIRAVYLEKTHTMKKMRKDHELACIGFRKWVIEQKKKTKKDPLPLARIEVSKVSCSVEKVSTLYDWIVVTAAVHL